MGKYLQVSITYFYAITKNVIRNFAKASYLDHTHPLFIQYKCLKFLDIVKFKTTNNFITIEEIHSYIVPGLVKREILM